MGMELLYKVHNNLYVNLTNKCPCACTFCLRQTMDRMGESDTLWLDREPTAQEVIEKFADFDMSRFGELVFCGFGEHTEAFEVLKEVASYAKKNFGIAVRVNTNGLGSLVNGRDITPELKGIVDTVSISLNNPDEEQYLALVRSKFGQPSYQAMLQFAKSASAYVPHVVMTTVATTITKEQEEACAKICEELGVTYRIRPWEE